MPPTSFAGTPMANRIQTAADSTAGYSLITRPRLTTVTNDTGGVTTVAYSSVDASCTAGSFPTPNANTTTCYPDYWTPTGASSSVQDWFSLYTARTVTAIDSTGGAPPQVTSYTYGGAGWHFDDDTLSRSATRTWDQWRGFRTVTTRTGTAPDPVSKTVDTYLQGMSGDPTGCTTFPCGPGATVTVTSSHGDAIDDADAMAGVQFESIVYNGDTADQVSDTIHLPSGTRTATDSGTGFGSFMVAENGTRTYTPLAGGGARQSTVSYTHDSMGRVTQEIDTPDTTDPGQTTCVLTSYATDTTNHVLTLPSLVTVLATGSAACQATSAAQVVSSTTYTYDSAFNTTKTQRAVAARFVPLTGLSFTYVTSTTATYDQYGRMLTATDADNRTTTTAYSPTAGAAPVSVKVTDPAGLTTTTSYDPARNLPLTVTDPAGYQTTKAYDTLGSLTAQWTPGNPTSGPAVQTYTYEVSRTAPTVVTEQVEKPDGGYLTSKTLYDSFRRMRETQDQTAGGGSDLADITYDSNGRKALASDPYYISGPPSGTLLAAASGDVPSQTGYAYDGAGRVTRQIAYAGGVETWETDTSYGGNYTTTVPPQGGISQTTFTDGRGLTTAIYQYHAGAPAVPTDPPADYDKTTYTNTPAGKLAGIHDAAGSTWSYTYNLLGDQLTASLPDAGTTTNTYDNAEQLMSATDARGKQVSWTYDGDGRKTAKYDTTGGAAESTATRLTAWTYDTLASGKPVSATSYAGGSAYTEQITGYNAQGLPSGTATVIPATRGALAGTYTRQYTYAPTGQPTSYTDSAAGPLPAETVTTGYDPAGRPASLTGAGTYVSALSYTNLGQPQRYQLGTTARPAYVTDTYDPQTGRIAEQNTQTGTGQVSVGDLHYSYDHAGNITSKADTPGGSAADVQCFRYDYLARLTQAWAQGTTGCAGTPSASVEGGPAPYWTSYGYNSIDDLTGTTATTPAGATTATDNTYPAGAHPHALSTARITTAAGSTSTSYGYDPSGNLTTVAGTSQSQALTWSDAGQLAQDTVTPAGGPARNTSYVYAADDSLLLAADPDSTTLHLADEELSLDAATGTVAGVRYYTLGGITVASRAGTGSVAYLAGDQQGTDTLAIDAATLGVTRRYYDPYGNPRGGAAGGFPAGQKGFIGGTADTDTGLTNLGAREYQPATASFISPDPLLNPYEPGHLNAYAYAQDNPVTYSDPSGQCRMAPPGDPPVGCPTGPAPASHPKHQTTHHPSHSSGGGSSKPDYTVNEVSFTMRLPLNRLSGKVLEYSPLWHGALFEPGSKKKADTPDPRTCAALTGGLFTFCSPRGGAKPRGLAPGVPPIYGAIFGRPFSPAQVTGKTKWTAVTISVADIQARNGHEFLSVAVGLASDAVNAPGVSVSYSFRVGYFHGPLTTGQLDDALGGWSWIGGAHYTNTALAVNRNPPNGPDSVEYGVTTDTDLFGVEVALEYSWRIK
jgi:RHS repeat-associated protein